MSLPTIPKHQLSNEKIIKTEEDLNKITSKIDEPILVLRVFDFETMNYCGYHVLNQKDAFELLGATLSTSNWLRHEIRRLEHEIETIKNMGMFEFANKYCSSEELEKAGHQLARELLGGR